MVSILKIRLQAIPLNKIVQTEMILFLQNYSLQLETLGAFKIVSQKLGFLNRKLYVDLWPQSWKPDYKRVSRPLFFETTCTLLITFLRKI